MHGPTAGVDAPKMSELLREVNDAPLLVSQTPTTLEIIDDEDDNTADTQQEETKQVGTVLAPPSRVTQKYEAGVKKEASEVP